MKRITIGRASENDIIFDAQSISNHHADVVISNGRITITDHSTNGTWINGRKLHNDSCEIREWDKILLPGNVCLDWRMLVKYSKKTQRRDLSDYDSARSFMDFLFNTLNINFCEEISKEQIQKLVSETESVLTKKTINQTKKEYNIESALEDIRYHIDKRFIEISNMGYKHIGNKGDFSYTINIENQIDKVDKNQFIEIKASDTVQNVLDRIFSYYTVR